MSRFLLTSDIHLSPRPLDEYRWDIFRWLRVQGEQRRVDAIFLLGDLTDQKDRHTNAFINRIVDELHQLETDVEAPVILLAGNHDYTDPAAPLLRFLDRFHIEPGELRSFKDERIFIAPHRRWAEPEWVELDRKHKLSTYDLLLCHQTFRKALSESGMLLPGLRQGCLSAPVIISGDVHVPQRLGRVRYCGSPHPIHFGDQFAPRVLLWNDGKIKSIPRATIRKAVVEIDDVGQLAQQGLQEGDQAKVRLRLPRSRFHEWEELRAEARRLALEQGWLLCGLELKELQETVRVRLRGSPKARATPLQTFRRFCRANEVEEEMVEMGVSLLKGGE